MSVRRYLNSFVIDLWHPQVGSQLWNSSHSILLNLCNQGLLSLNSLVCLSLLSLKDLLFSIAQYKKIFNFAYGSISFHCAGCTYSCISKVWCPLLTILTFKTNLQIFYFRLNWFYFVLLIRVILTCFWNNCGTLGPLTAFG